MKQLRHRDPWRGQHRAFMLFIVLVTLGTYLGSAEVYFIKDDLSLRGAMSDEAGEFDADLWMGQLIWPTERTWDDIWRPIPALSWALDYKIFGPDPIAFHIGNFLLHALNAVLIYWLFARWSRFRSLVPPFFAALGFALWPLHPEAVIWTTQRTVVMGLFFCLVALLFYDSFLHRRKKSHLVLAWIAFVLGLLSREHAAALPACFVVLSLLFGPARPLKLRIREVLVHVCAIGIPLLMVYFGCRYLIFDRFTGGYSGYPTMEAYQEELGVYKRLGDTIRICFVPGNKDLLIKHEWLGVNAHQAFLVFQAGVLGLIAVRLLTSISRSMVMLRILALVAIFSATSWLPVYPVFYVEENLINSRSGYHMTGLVAAFALFAVSGLSFLGAGKRKWGVILGTVVLLTWSAVLQQNLVAYEGGGRQVRGVQETLGRAAAKAAPKTAFLVLDSPAVYNGCPTIEAYLPQLMGPPYTHGRLPVMPLVAGQRHNWPSAILQPGPHGLSALRGPAAKHPVQFLRGSSTAPWLHPMFGPAEAARGEIQPRLIAPRDGEVMVVTADGAVLLAKGPPLPGYGAGIFNPQAAVSGASIESVGAGEGWPVLTAGRPIFTFELPAPAARVTVLMEVPDRRLEAELAAPSSGKFEGRVQLRLGDTPLRAGTQGIPWPLPLDAFRHGLPVLWRIIVRDEAGAVIGVSATQRFVFLAALPPPTD